MIDRGIIDYVIYNTLLQEVPFSFFSSLLLVGELGCYRVTGEYFARV